MCRCSSVKCHLLCSLTSFVFFLIRQVAVSWLSVTVTHTLRKTSWGHLWAFRGKEIITVADSSYFVYAQYHRLSFSFYCINLSFSHTVLTHLGTAPTNVCLPTAVAFLSHIWFLYLSATFCHSGLKCLPYDRYYHVRKRWQDLLRIILLRVVCLHYCARFVRTEDHKLQWLYMWVQGMKCKVQSVQTKFSSVKVKLQGYQAFTPVKVEGIHNSLHKNRHRQ